jgi:hypothetical protein
MAGSRREEARAPQFAPAQPTVAEPPREISSRKTAVALDVSATEPRPTRVATRDGISPLPASGASTASTTLTVATTPAVAAPATVVTSAIDKLFVVEVTEGGDGATVPGEVDSATSPPLPAASSEPLDTVHVVAASNAQEA